MAYHQRHLTIEGPDERKHMLVRKIIKIQEYAAMCHRLVQFFLAEDCLWRAVQAQEDSASSYDSARSLLGYEE